MSPLPIFPPPKRLTLLGGVTRVLPEPHWEWRPGTSEAYQLVLRSESLQVSATRRGASAARATMWQLEKILETRGSLPCVEIEDAPDLAVRGFMLDISRGRVPNRRQLGALVDGLWLLKFNQLQLYTEHVFAYPGHEAVWAGTGALTGDDVRWLDRYCAERGIELVPNQNTFGHMENWLKHPAYHHLAESPGGYTHPVLGWRGSGGVLRPDPESAVFVRRFLENYLPHFTSKQVHIGCDETWELGQGVSRERAAVVGKALLFDEHLRRLVDVARQLGKRPQFWADIFLHTPSTAWSAYRDCLPVVWGYEPGHPFKEALHRLREAGLPALLAPGTSAWNSFGGRWDAARRNIREAVAACRQFGAEGLLLTSWGDNGHGYPAPIMWPAMVLAGALGWSGTCRLETLRLGMEVLNGAPDPAATKALIRLGRLDRVAGAVSPNMSGIYRSALGITLQGVSNPYAPMGPQRDRALEGIQWARQALSRDRSIDSSSSRVPEGNAASAEPGNGLRDGVALAIDLSEWAIHHAAGSPVPEHLRTVGDRFRKDWLATAQSPVPRLWDCLPTGERSR